MSCCSPLIGLAYNNRTDGKRTLKIVSFEDRDKYPDTDERKKILIPCGHCIECRKEQSKQWSNRMLMESYYHEDMYFITLTLCNEYAVVVPSYDPATGEYCDKETLDKKDVQDFVKRFRKRFPDDKLRYYFVGEYGPRNGKAHYHAILFVDWHKDEKGNKVDGFDDAKLKGVSECGSPSFESKTLEELWSQSDARTKRLGFPKGMNKEAFKSGKSPNLLGWCEMSKANYNTIRYVGNYVQKKLGESPNNIYESMNLVPPFALMSRKPGIGVQYLEEHPEAMYEKSYLSTGNGVVECAPPRLFKKKLQEVDSDKFDELSERNKRIAQEKMKCILDNTDVDEVQYRENVGDTSLHRRASRDRVN